MNAPFPFIVGCGRSGSTLLRSMLDAHPDMAVPAESYFLEQLLQRKDGFVPSGRFELDEFIHELRIDARFLTWGIEVDGVLTAVRAAQPEALADAIRALYTAVAAGRGATRFADKTPAYALSVPVIASVLPESVFVHLVRDPRDVAASYRGASWGPRSLVSAGRMWAERAGAAHAAGQELGPTRYLELHYESLVADPEGQLQRLCAFIDLPFSPAMLDYERSEAARSTARRDGGAHTALLQRPTVAIRDWRTELTAAEAARVGTVAGGLTTTLGYEPSPSMTARDAGRYGLERALAAGESLSLRFRRTRMANRMRGPWRVLRRRATLDQILSESS